MAEGSDHSTKLAAAEVWREVFSSKLDEILYKLERMEERFESRIDREVVALERMIEKEQARIETLEQRLARLEMQRWILGGAAVAGGGSGIAGLLKMMLGG